VQHVQHPFHHLLVDDLAQADPVGVLGRHVDGHVVVQDLDRQILALLPEDRPAFLLDHRASAMVGIDDLIAEFVQPLLLCTGRQKRRPRRLRNSAIVAQIRMDSQLLAVFEATSGPAAH
jgi:hypothetical protein